MSILFLSFPYASSPGGGERYTEQTVEGLARAGFKAKLVSSSQALLELFRRRGWETRTFWCGFEPVTPVAALFFPLTAWFALLFFAFLLAKERRSAQAVVCLSLTDKLLATPCALLFGLKVVWVEHLIAGRSLRLNPYRFLYVALSKKVRIVTVSRIAAASLAVVGVPPERIHVISPGVAPVGPSALPGTLTIGAVSRLSREKNIAMLLRAYALVIEKIPKAKLVICGSGNQLKMLEGLARELGIQASTSFRGHVPRANETCRFDVLAVPSLKESFGMAALEAMNNGTPVVAARVGGLPEVIEDGVTGLLVPANDEKAMADALVALLNDPFRGKRMGEDGRRRAVERFSEEKMQNAWIDFLS